MEYEVLYLNDDNTAKVRMTINDNVLEQDFPVDNLDANVKQGMAIFQAELQANTPATPPDDSIVGRVVPVSTLPTLPSSDFEPESPSPPLES